MTQSTIDSLDAIKKLIPRGYILFTVQGARMALQDRIDKDALGAKLTVCEAQLLPLNNTILNQGLEIAILKDRLKVSKGWNVKLVVGIGIVVIVNQFIK